MSVGDPDDFDCELMAMAQPAQQYEGGDEDLLVTKERVLNKKEEPFSTNPATAETGETKIQELSDEETEKLQKQLDLKCKLETSSTKEPVTKNCDGDCEKDNNDLQSNSGNGYDLPNYPSTQTLPEIGEKVSPNKVDVTALPCKVTMDESLEENRKNPLLLNPVIRCVLKFLSIADLKSARLVCREWGSNGKLSLASRALIHFRKYEDSKEPDRLPVDFQSCFLDSAAHFSAFKISGCLAKRSRSAEDDSWMIEELTSFFDEQQKCLTELTLKFSDDTVVKNVDIYSWISKSPLVQKDAKYLTKLSIQGDYCWNDGAMVVDRSLTIPPLHLIAHIKDLTLSQCRINFEPGIKISSIKFKLEEAIFFQGGIKLDHVRINDIVDFGNAKEIALECMEFEDDATKYVVDLSGNSSLDKLILSECEIVNGETSQWAVEHLATNDIPYSLNSQMKIKELFLDDGPIDLFTLPTSLQKLVLVAVNNNRITISCSQPIELQLQNLQYLQITHTAFDFEFLSHFKNCPQLTFLKFYQCGEDDGIKSILIPRNVKALTLEGCQMKWVGEPDEDYRKLEKLVVGDFRNAKKLCEAKFQVDDFVVDCYDEWKMDKSLVEFLEHRKRFNFGNRLYIGNLKWDEMKIEESVLFKYVDVKSSCYVFENWEKGRSIPEKAYLELLPKHMNTQEYLPN